MRQIEPSGEIRISDNSRIVFYGIYIPVDTFMWVLPHLLKIQRLSEARVSGGNLFRSTTDSSLLKGGWEGPRFIRFLPKGQGDNLVSTCI